ncbi:curli-like amyloid fiber formation chaperone CsgH [Methylobacterium persicinum]|uniref:curli-like amyloid fiber formation chaperone CsgH n=1 Tax=Methylobacterium persicinum TaxID=374426 RepID=UPI00352130F8
MPLSTPPDPPGLRCELTQQVQGATVSITGLVFASEVKVGTYQLRVVKKGPAGTSVLNQGGTFTAKPSEASPIGHLALSVEAGGGYTAHLLVASGDSRAECEDVHERL